MLEPVDVELAAQVDLVLPAVRSDLGPVALRSGDDVSLHGDRNAPCDRQADQKSYRNAYQVLHGTDHRFGRPIEQLVQP
jgi:hypothetical protein